MRHDGKSKSARKIQYQDYYLLPFKDIIRMKIHFIYGCVYRLGVVFSLQTSSRKHDLIKQEKCVQFINFP